PAVGRGPRQRAEALTGPARLESPAFRDQRRHGGWLRETGAGGDAGTGGDERSGKLVLRAPGARMAHSRRGRASGGEGLHHPVQPALVAGGFVLADDALVGHGVDNGDGVTVGLARRVLVAFLHGLDDVLD